VLAGAGYGLHRLPAQAPDEAYPYAGIPYDPNGVPDEAYVASFPAESLAARSFYNIGAGSFRHKFWTNVDFSSDWYAGQQADSKFINHDLFSLKPLPIPSANAEAVYTSHTVEHVNDEACAVLFREAHRILKPGGVFRMTTPNIALDLAAYRRGDRHYFYWIDFYSHPKVCETAKIRPFNSGSLQQIVLFAFATHLSELALATNLPKVSDAEFDAAFRAMSDEDALNMFSHRCTIEAQRQAPGYHINWWTEEKATRMLREAGFERVWRSGYGQSCSPAMRDVNLFDKQDPKVSLYIEAQR
jgi:SAM-dependent methyltransferase